MLAWGIVGFNRPSLPHSPAQAIAPPPAVEWLPISGRTGIIKKSHDRPSDPRSVCDSGERSRRVPASTSCESPSVDPVVAARSGFTPQEIEVDASAILQGEPATTPVVVNDRSYTIRVRFPERSRATLDDIRNTMLTSSSTGKAATLGSLAQFQDEV